MGLVLLASTAYADELPVIVPSTFDIKQGFVIPWENVENGFMNMSTVTVMQTERWERLGNWNALWDGWTIDAAWSYDAGTSNFGVMLGRKLGTLGQYIPITYPLADKVDVTLYPLGIIVDHPFDDPEISGASGAGIIKLSLSF